jgi:hypothetical protein
MSVAVKVFSIMSAWTGRNCSVDRLGYRLHGGSIAVFWANQNSMFDDLVVSSGPPPVAAPNVVDPGGRRGGDVAANLAVGTVEQQSSAAVPAGAVSGQTPAADTLVAPGSAVDLVVSSGPPPVSVPLVVGLTQADATTAIVNVGLIMGSVTTAEHATIPTGAVMSQTPSADTSVSPGSAVDLVVSGGPPPVAVPNVVGQSQAVAEAAIVAANLAVGTITQQSSATVPAGSVVSQNPAAGSSLRLAARSRWLSLQVRRSRFIANVRSALKTPPAHS